jgi:hypothetical protein
MGKKLNAFAHIYYMEGTRLVNKVVVGWMDRASTKGRPHRE